MTPAAPLGRGSPAQSRPSGGVLVGLGLDTVDLARFQAVLARRPSLAERVFGEAERGYASGLANPVPSLAARFAAKEAVMKALGVGVGSFDWRDVQVVRRPGGRPLLEVTGRAKALAEQAGVRSWQVSLTHTDLVASAVVAGLA